MSLYDPKWFRIPYGEHEGRLHISGWMLSAIKGEGSYRNDGTEISSGWLRYASCPVCEAMVVAEEHPSFRDRTWGHERWHARTDFPVPEELLNDEDRKAGYVRP